MARRILEYFERIDLRIAGNEAILNRMARYLIAQKLMIEATDQEGRTSHSKTDLGEKLHALLEQISDSSFARSSGLCRTTTKDQSTILQPCSAILLKLREARNETPELVWPTLN